MEVSVHETVLFGADKGWSSEDWTASDDRVRGGKSESCMKLEKGRARFCGTLDIDTLGGAGFASQRTSGDCRQWDFTGEDGIELTIDLAHSDRKQYTFIIKDELLPKNSKNGREQSTTSWEHDFEISGDLVQDHKGTIVVFIPWDKFQPTYRGKKVCPKKPLDTAHVKRLSIMMRSFFGTQKGAFTLSLVKITTVRRSGTASRDPHSKDQESDQGSLESLSKTDCNSTPHQPNSIWSRLLRCCHI